MANSKHESTVRLTGEVLFLQVFMAYAVVSVGFLFSMPAGRICFPLALTGGLILPAAWGIPFKTILRAGMYSLLWWCLAIIIMLPLTDASFDGNFYHQEIIAAVCEGWTPADGDSYVPMNIFSLHYAKGIEMAQAAVVTCVGRIEAGKAVNLILMLSSGLIVYGFATDFIRGISPRGSRWVALVAVLNPVAVCQIFTFYIDFCKYIYTLLTIVYLLAIGSGKLSGRNVTMLSVLVIMAIGTKFNVFFEEGAVIAAALIWWMWHRRYEKAWKVCLVGVASLLIGSLVLGYHPYITNMTEAGHPLYPLMGEGKVDIMTSNTPEFFMDGNRFVNFFISLLTPEIPRVDSRAGGYGILMILMLFVSCRLIWKQRREWHGLVVYISVWVIASCFFFEQSWWARYITQLWLVVVCGTVVSVASGSFKISRNILYVCVVLTAAVCAVSALGRDVRATMYREKVLSCLKGEDVKVVRLNEAFRRQMAERGVNGIYAEDEDTPWRIAYYGSLDTVYPVLVLDSLKYESIITGFECLPFDFSNSYLPAPE